MVKTIISLAQNFNLGIVTEGVETKNQLTILKGLGCDYAQGYFIARPIQATEFEQQFLLQPNWGAQHEIVQNDEQLIALSKINNHQTIVQNTLP